jgi:colanic acid/amylovoran biosynthesis glycosyltransferase
MDLFLFTNLFPYKKSEPFLVNEFEFTKRSFKTISILALYGENKDAVIGEDQQVKLLAPILGSPRDKMKIFLGGVFNFASCRYHIKDFFHQTLFLQPAKLYWFFTSLLLTRLVLSSKSYKALLSSIAGARSPVLYFYWGDNLCWIIPYLKKNLKQKNVKIVIRLHRTDLYENLKAGYAPLRKQIFSHADVIAPISNDGKTYLENKYPVFKHRLFLSRLGVFDHGLNPVNRGVTRHVISVSALVEVKRVQLIFEVLQHSGSKITWHHFGDGPLSANIKALVKQKRENLEVILHGFVDNKMLMDFYRKQSVDLLINLSASEGLPVSIMEALSFGVPVLATNVGGTAELVDDQVGKLIESAFDKTEIAAQIDLLLSLDEDKSQTLRKNARSAFEKKVNADSNYPGFYEFVLKA